MIARVSEMTTCPYCMSPTKEAEPTSACQSCGATYHTECWDESRGCCVTGCANKRAAIEIDIPPDEPAKLELSRESVERARSHRAQARSLRNPCVRCGQEVPSGELYCVECAPAREDGQDTRNVGPILAMLGVLGVLLAWFVTATLSNQPAKAPPPPTNKNAPIGTTR